MTTPQKWKSFSVRLDEPRKLELDELLTDHLKDSDKNKADAVYDLIKKGLELGEETQTHSPEDDISIQDVLNEIECPYLYHDIDGFSCLEKMAQSKKANSLGFNPTKTLSFCRACANRKMELRVIKQNELLNRAGAKQLKEFLKRMVQLKDKNFALDVYLCMCETHDNKIQASADGETLKCALLPENENQTVFIESYCRKRINPIDGSIGCPSLVSFTQVTNLDESFFKQFTIEHPELENISEVKIIPQRTNSVEADFKVIEENPDKKEKPEND